MAVNINNWTNDIWYVIGYCKIYRGAYKYDDIYCSIGQHYTHKSIDKILFKSKNMPDLPEVSKAFKGQLCYMEVGYIPYHPDYKEEK